MKEIQLHRIDLNLLVVFEALMTEGSVAKAADRLGKTPSAVSHALARLRDQVGDPLMVRVGGRMQPSPFALTLIEDVRPILRSIKRVLALPEPFDPATSTRVFRLACVVTGQFVTNVVKEIQSTASGIAVEWLASPRDVFDAVNDGLVDMALLGGERRLPDGLEGVDVPELVWNSFVRADHPALKDWGPEAWSRYPHVKVNVANDAASPVDTSPAAHAPGRWIGAQISEFSNVAQFLAETDYIGTFPRVLMAWDMETYGLRPLQPPVEPAGFRTRFYWSSRLSSDPALKWFRHTVLNAYRDLHEEANRIVEARLSEHPT